MVLVWCWCGGTGNRGFGALGIRLNLHRVQTIMKYFLVLGAIQKFFMLSVFRWPHRFAVVVSEIVGSILRAFVELPPTLQMHAVASDVDHVRWGMSIIVSRIPNPCFFRLCGVLSAK